MAKSMPNSKAYRFSDFTHAHYRELIQVAKRKYRFISYNEIEKQKDEILWRHDVDFSLTNALGLARIEAEEGVKSNFFFWLHSEFYNVFEYGAKAMINEIISLGHSIGLHFDSHFYQIKHASELDKYLVRENEFFAQTFEIKPVAFSFHNTTEFTMSCTDWQYAGLINAYAEYFQNETGYCSDSNGYWKYERLFDVLNAPVSKPLQILTHPVWWSKETMSPKQKVKLCTQERADANVALYEHNLAAFGNNNIDW